MPNRLRAIKNINCIRLTQVVSGKINAAARIDGVFTKINEFSDWPSAEQWAKRTYTFSKLWNPTTNANGTIQPKG